MWVLLLLTNCKKEEETPIPFDSSCSKTTIRYNVRLKQESHPYFTWTSGTCVYRQTTFDATLDGATLPTSITTSVVTTVNLFTGVSTPQVVTTEITSGNYTNIGISMELQDNGVDDNIILQGIYTRSDNTQVPIRFLFNSGEVFEAVLASYFFEGGTSTTCWLQLNPNGWFSIIPRDDLDNGVLDGSGVMVISENSNTDIYNPVEMQLVATTLTNGSIVCE